MEHELDPKQYGQTVTQLQSLLGTSTHNQWAMGDLILALVPYHSKVGTQAVLEQLESDLNGEVKLSTMRNLRATSYAYPPRERKKASWSAHNYLRSNPDLLRDGMTSNEALRAVSKKPQNRFKYTCALLQSATRFMRASERYVARSARREERMEVLAPLILAAEEALEALLDAAGMSETEVRERVAA